MKLQVTLLLFCVPLVLGNLWISKNAINLNASKPKIELYFETICPYSKMFFLEQLEPAYQELADLINVEVIPFGNVKVTSGPDNLPLFKCQHGSAECYGNRAQACVIDQSRNTSQILAYVKCMFGQSNWRNTCKTAELCANRLRLNWDRIKECTDGSKGQELIVANWKRTDSLVPKHHYVPWIVINGVHTEELQEQAQENLIKYLCDNFLGEKNANACSSNAFDWF